MGVEGGEIRSCKIRSSLDVTLRFLGSHIKCFFLAGWKNDLETTSSPLLPTPPSVITQIHCPFSCFFHLQPSLMRSSLRCSSVWLMPLDKQMTHHVYFTWRQVFFFLFFEAYFKEKWVVSHLFTMSEKYFQDLIVMNFAWKALQHVSKVSCRPFFCYRIQMFGVHEGSC